MNRHIVHVITNRASYGRIKSVLKEIENTDGLRLTVIKAGAGVDLDVDVNVSYTVHCLVNDDSHSAMVKTACLMAMDLTSIFEKIKPDIVLIHGDRYEQLGVAMAASYLNITIAHTEGGEESGCIDDKVRNSITALADIHFAVTSNAFLTLHKTVVKYSEFDGKEFNVITGNLFQVGSPAIDLCKQAVENGFIVDNEDPYILVLHHPNTTLKEQIKPLIRALDGIPLKKIWINSNVDAGSREMAKLLHKTDWEFKKNLTPEEYYILLNNCECAVGNSSSFLKEGAFLGVPAVVVGDRQHNRESQENVIFVSDKYPTPIENAICDQLDHGRYEQSYVYGDGTASKKIVTVLREVSL